VRIEPVTAFDNDPRSGVGQFQADYEVADISARGTCMDQITTRREGSA
jgi:hypothetical protein